jgi:hypothetical protein
MLYSSVEHDGLLRLIFRLIGRSTITVSPNFKGTELVYKNIVVVLLVRVPVNAQPLSPNPGSFSSFLPKTEWAKVLVDIDAGRRFQIPP